MENKDHLDPWVPTVPCPLGGTRRQCQMQSLVSRDFHLQLQLSSPVLPSSFPCVLTFEPPALPLCTSCLGSINKGRTPFLLPQKNPLFPLPLSPNLCMTFVDPAGRASQAIRPYSTEPALPAKPFPGAKQRVSWFLEFEFLCLPL